jgi:hypothetical protein
VLLAKAAYAALLHNRDHFADRVTAILDSWLDGEDRHADWAVEDARRLLEKPARGLTTANPPATRS